MTYRVVQWATGCIGNVALRTIIEDPQYELVGVFVYTPDKEGKDAGELVGLPPTGVVTTSKREEILALDADIVVHMAAGLGPMEVRDDDVLALLRSGKNVISTMSYWWPETHGAEYAGMFEEAARAGGVTLMGAGMNPDCAGSWLPAALTRMCTDVKRISVTEIDDMAPDPHANMIVELLGMGKPLDQWAPDMEGAQYMLRGAQEIPSLLARNVGVTLEKIDMDIQVLTATRDVSIPATEIKKDTVCGAEFKLTGFWQGEPFIDFELFYTAQRDHPRFPEIPYDTRYIIDIEGSPSLHTTIDMNPTLDPDTPRTADQVQAVMHSTAACAVNAIPAVCAAAPGLFTMPVPGAWNPKPAAP